METVTECPVCGSSQLNPYIGCKDYLVSQQEFSIQQCNQCHFRLTNPRPSPNNIGAYYKSDQYVSHNDASSGLINTIYRLVRNYTLQSKLKLINRLTRGKGHLLDVGCGTGEFLKTCQAAGWQVHGMEPDDTARAAATQKLQMTISRDLGEVSGSNSFDIITLWHVLEHIPDLNLTITKLNRLLSDQGALIIAVPNSDSYDARFYKQHWAAYDVPRHLHHFTPTTIVPLFEKHGLRLVEQHPMVFDAFYIAMLSSRYLTGRTDYLQSLQVGLTSNRTARRTGNASSVIYVFRKA